MQSALILFLLSPELFLIGVVHEHPEVYIIITSIRTHTGSFLLGLQYTFSSIISGRYLESQLNEVSDNARVNEYIAQSQSISDSSHPAIFTRLLCRKIAKYNFSRLPNQKRIWPIQNSKVGLLLSRADSLKQKYFSRVHQDFTQA